MFGSVKMSGRRLTLLSVSCFLIFLGVCLMMLRATAPDTVEIGGEPYPLSAESDEDIVRFIAGCGHEAGELVSDGEITVPKTWNAVYEEYNELQRAQGLDLVPYKGKTARRLVYSLSDSEGYAEVLLSDGRIIAAHISPMTPGSQAERLIQ